MTDLDPDFLSILRCPVCRGRLDDEPDRLVCVECGRRYRIDDGIPALAPDLAEEA